MDLGLCVKHGAKGVCVPDYVQAQPDNNGWAYSQALVTVIEQYKVGAQTFSLGHAMTWLYAAFSFLVGMGAPSIVTLILRLRFVKIYAKLSVIMNCKCAS